MFRGLALAIAFLPAVLLGTAGRAESAEKPTVYVVNYPLQYFSERIGGDAIEVVFPVPPGDDPAFWTPSPSEVQPIQKADLILLNGAGYAKWVKKVSLRKSRMINTSGAFSDQLIQVESKTTHRHGPSGDHAHAGVAFTTWLDFEQARRQSQAISRALGQLLPDRAAEFEENALNLQRDLSELDARLKELGKKTGDKPLLASHPVYQYMARRYQLNLRSVLWEPEVVPDLIEWRKFEKLHAEHPAKWIFWEGVPLAKSAEQLYTLGVTSIVFSPCANVPTEGDFLSVMNSNIKALENSGMLEEKEN